MRENGQRACVTCDVISRYHRNITLQNYNLYERLLNSYKKVKVLRLNHIKYQQEISVDVLLGLIYGEQSKDARRVKKYIQYAHHYSLYGKAPFP